MRSAPGNDIELGSAVGTGKPLVLSKDARDKHLYVAGATGTGKSKFLEHLIRQDIVNWRKSKCGLLLLDPHGSLYDSLMAWLTWTGFDRPVIPIDLRRDDWGVAYNVLRPRAVADPAVIVNDFVQAMAYVWGQSNTSQTPLFNRWASNILWTLYEKKQTLLETEYLTDRTGKRLRRALTEDLKSRSVANDWAFADTLSPKEFEAQIGSTINRLHSFLGTQSLRRMFGQGGVSLDLNTALTEGHIILVSLATEKSRVSDEDASLFATLLLSDLWASAKERGKNTSGVPQKPFRVYADEFQNFVTPTMARNLDQARGFGLHLTLAHQFPNQLLHTGAHGKQVYDSILVNARSKVVFSMEGEENLRPLAQALFMGVLDPNKIKLELFGTRVLGYAEENRRVSTRSRSESHGTSGTAGASWGHGAGGTTNYLEEEVLPISRSESVSEFEAQSASEGRSHVESTGESESDVPMLIPQMGKELSSVQFESLEEQLFRAMAALFDQEQRRCVARTVGTRMPVELLTPTVKAATASHERVEAYFQKQVNRWPFMVKTGEAQRRLDERAKELAERFSNSSTNDEPVSARRRVK